MILAGGAFFSSQRLMTIRAFCEIEASLRSYAKLLRMRVVENNGVVVAASDVREAVSIPDAGYKQHNLAVVRVRHD